jgi:hypothetical protein
MAYDKWVKELKAKNPWQSGPTEGESFDDYSTSLSKLITSNFTYLGRADEVSSSSSFNKFPSSNEISNSPHISSGSPLLAIRPIASDPIPKEADLKVLHITGKQIQPALPLQKFSGYREVEDFLPQIQKAPQNIPGEFITFKYQIPNVKLQISKNLPKFQIYLPKISNTGLVYSDDPPNH